MTTTDPTPANWRDLAADLTPQQRQYLETFEERLGALAAPADVTALLIDKARELIEDRLVDSTFADIPAPAGAEVDRWERDNTGGWFRDLTWREMGTGPIGVAVDGRQHQDGRVERAVSVYCDGSARLTAEAARQLAAELIAAADLLDSLPPPPQ